MGKCGKVIDGSVLQRHSTGKQKITITSHWPTNGLVDRVTDSKLRFNLECWR